MTTITKEFLENRIKELAGQRNTALTQAEGYRQVALKLEGQIDAMAYMLNMFENSKEIPPELEKIIAGMTGGTPPAPPAPSKKAQKIAKAKARKGNK